jgi:hypothetical protein
MAINPLIALSVKSMDTADKAQYAVKMKRQQEIDAQESELRGYQIANERIKNLDAREQERINSVIYGAAELGTYLEGGDLKAAEDFLNKRRAALGQRIAAGDMVDTAQTDEALAVIRSGDPEKIKALQGQIGQLVKLGTMRGMFKEPASEGFNLSPGQRRYDAFGNVLAENPKQPDGLRAVADPETGEITYEPTRKLTATDTKEIYEASDVIQSGQGAKEALTRALNLMKGGNDGTQKKPYSGFGATMRAGAARVPVFGNIVADKERGAATTEYDALIKEQALGNMKAIFGGNPTEGERQVLLQMQAIADYTPDEQERIISNAMKAIERREKFNQSKIEAIQSGDYSALANTEFKDFSDSAGNAQGAEKNAETPRQKLERLRALKAQQR